MVANINDYIIAAIVVELYQQGGNVPPGYMSLDRLTYSLKKILDLDISDASLNKAVSQLIDDRVVRVISDDLAGKFYSIDKEVPGRMFLANKEKPDTLIYKYAHIGQPLLANALDRSHQSDFSKDDAYMFSAIPASDRIVRLDDNHVPRDEILRLVEEVQTSVRGSNNVNKGFMEAKPRVLVELEAGKDLLQAPSLRIKALWAVLGSALAYIATEFAGAVAGDLASRLLDILKIHFGF